MSTGRISSPRLIAFVFTLVALPWIAGAQSSDPDPFPDPVSQSVPTTPNEPARPAALMPLYGSFAALQVLDFDTTLRAIQNSAGREGNPIMQAVIGSPAAFAAVKAGTVISAVIISERLRKRHPTAAIAFMIGLNSVYTVPAARNYRRRWTTVVIPRLSGAQSVGSRKGQPPSGYAHESSAAPAYCRVNVTC